MKKVGLVLLIILVFGFCSCATEETIKIVEYGNPFCREDFNIYNADGSIYKDPDNEDNGYIVGSEFVKEYWQTARGLNLKSTINDMLEAYKDIEAVKIQFANDFEDTQNHVLPDVIKNKSIRKGRKVNITFEYDGYTMILEYMKDTLTSIRVNTPQYNAEQQAKFDELNAEQAKRKAEDNKSSTTFDDYIKKNKITLTAREVQYNMSNNTDNKFILEGLAELSDYYNYGFRDWTDDYFCLEVYPDNETISNRWYIYCSRDSFEKLFDKAINNKTIYVQMVCEIPSYVYQKNQGNLARLEFVYY